jgi:hypothetical protein
VLTTLLLLQAGYAYVPYSSLESVIEQSKEAYYLALRQTQGTIRTESPNWQPWLVFFLRSLAEQVRRLEKKVEREKIVLAAMPELQLQIVEFAREHGRVTIGEAIKLTGASRNTLKQHFRALVERGTLDQHGSGRGVWYGWHLSAGLLFRLSAAYLFAFHLPSIACKPFAFLFQLFIGGHENFLHIVFDGLVDHPSQLFLGDIAYLQDVPENDFKVLGKCLEPVQVRSGLQTRFSVFPVLLFRATHEL